MFIFSSSGYLDVSVHRVIFAYSMYSSMDVRTLLLTGCPIRISAGLRLFPPYRSVSPVIASFIGFLCQGIHRMPLVTYPKYLLKSLLVSNCLLFRFVIISYYAFNLSKNFLFFFFLVELIRIELITSALQGRRSPS